MDARVGTFRKRGIVQSATLAAVLQGANSGTGPQSKLLLLLNKTITSKIEIIILAFVANKDANVDDK